MRGPPGSTRSTRSAYAPWLPAVRQRSLQTFPRNPHELFVGHEVHAQQLGVLVDVCYACHVQLRSKGGRCGRGRHQRIPSTVAWYGWQVWIEAKGRGYRAQQERQVWVGVYRNRVRAPSRDQPQPCQRDAEATLGSHHGPTQQAAACTGAMPDDITTRTRWWSQSREGARDFERAACGRSAEASKRGGLSGSYLLWSAHSQGRTARGVGMHDTHRGRQGRGCVSHTGSSTCTLDRQG